MRERDSGDNDGFQRRSFAPVSVGDELDVTIEAVGEKGDGVAKVKGFVLFVPNVKEGDHVKVRVNKVLRKVGFAEVIGAGSAAAAPEKPKEEPKPEDTEDFGDEEIPEPEAEEKAGDEETF